MADEDLDDEGLVIPFLDKLAGYKPLGPVLAEERRGGWENPNLCPHDGTILYNRPERTMRCKKCGVLLDPFEALLLIDLRYQTIEWKLAEIRDQRAKDRAKAARDEELRARRRNGT